MAKIVWYRFGQAFTVQSVGIEKTFVLTHLEGFLVVSGLFYDSSPPLPGDNWVAGLFGSHF